MTTFTAWKFETDDGAAKAVVALEAAQTDGLVTLVDHAVISWPQGEQRPELHHARDDTKRGTAWGSFWGLLFGGLFFAPLLGAAVGAGVGAVAKSVAGVGIPEEDLESIRSQLTEGTSLLCAVTEGADMDRLGERLRDVVVDVLASGAPSGIRTHTGSGLSRTPLPVGLSGPVASISAHVLDPDGARPRVNGVTRRARGASGPRAITLCP